MRWIYKSLILALMLMTVPLSARAQLVFGNGFGNVVGPSSATDNCVVRFDGTTGKLIKNSGVCIDNSNNVTGVVALTYSGQLTSTVVTGTAPLVIASTTAVANLNASLLGGATFAAPGAIGGGTPAAGSFTTLSASTSLAIGTAQAGTPRQFNNTLSDALTSTTGYAARLEHVTSGTAAAGFGVGREVYLENASGTSVNSASEEFAWSTATNAAETGTYALKIISAGTLANSMSFDGRDATFRGSIRMSGNQTIAAWTGSGAGYIANAATKTDSSSSGTVATVYMHFLGIPTIAASSTTTYTDAYTLFVSNIANGTNVTMTNKWAAGFNGAVNIIGNETVGGATITFSNAAFTTCTALTTVANVLTCTASDERLKNGIGSISPEVAMGFIRAVDPKTYSFKEGTPWYDGGRKRLGFYAQDVQKYLPLAVMPIGEGHLQIDTVGMVAAHQVGLRYLDGSLVALEARVRALEAANDNALSVRAAMVP